MNEDIEIQTLNVIETVNTIDNDEFERIKVEKSDECKNERGSETENTYISFAETHSETEMSQNKCNVCFDEIKIKLTNRKNWKFFFFTCLRLLIFILVTVGMFWFLYEFVLKDIVNLIIEKISKAFSKLFNQE